MTTASLPRSTETAVTGVFSCPVNVERNEDDGCYVTVPNEKQNTRGRLLASIRTGLTQSLQSILAYLFRLCFAIVDDEPAAEHHQGRRDTRSVSSAVVFFVRKNQAVGPFSKDFLVYLCVKKLHGTFDSSFFEWQLDSFSVSDLSHMCSVKFENRIR